MFYRGWQNWHFKWPIFTHTGRDTGVCLSYVARRPFRNEPEQTTRSLTHGRVLSRVAKSVLSMG
ncbi:Valine--tRNA ligase [Gossypium arboreum]|uniref:Valine--tRNA ligase n=1 Tax=Gossypium arboreum TaxID=29729 RepID=A0A0B0N2I6_GOSAR|nr:Valine--tRNA ligase [Gossypium arboreum]